METEETKKTQIPIEERWQMVGAHRLGILNKDIAEYYNVSISAVSRLLSKWQTIGDVKNYRKSGRPSKYENDHINQINEIMSQNSIQTVGNLRRQLDFSIPRSSLTEILHELEFSFKKKQKSFFLTDSAKMNRLKHCQTHLSHDLDNIIFTDESFFKEFNCFEFSWVKNGESEQIESKQADKFGSVMIFGGISKQGITKIWVKPKQAQITADIYQDILSEVIIPFAKKHYRYGLKNQKNWWFQQDNAAAHTAKSTKQWLAEKNFQLFSHPPCSPDLNPIESVWSYIKIQLRNENKRFKREELITRIQEIWDDLDLELIKKIIDHTKTQYENVIANNGAYKKTSNSNKNR
ncbi:hypothetical protein ABPG72_009087 [Tetrahymena utriculariae]